MPDLGAALQASDIPDISATYGRTLAAEENSTPVTDDSDVTTGTANTYFVFLTMPSTYKFYLITGIEHKNGTTVTGNVKGTVSLIDVNPPVLNNKIQVAWGTIAQSGASSIQRNSAIGSTLIPGGSIVAIGLSTSQGTAQLRFQTGLGSQNQQAAVQSLLSSLAESTLWATATQRVYAKLYYKGII